MGFMVNLKINKKSELKRPTKEDEQGYEIILHNITVQESTAATIDLVCNNSVPIFVGRYVITRNQYLKYIDVISGL